MEKTKLYLRNPATHAILFRPIKSNIVEAHGQIAQLLESDYTKEEIASIKLPSPQELSSLLDSMCWNLQWCKCDFLFFEKEIRPDTKYPGASEHWRYDVKLSFLNWAFEQNTFLLSCFMSASCNYTRGMFYRSNLVKNKQ